MTGMVPLDAWAVAAILAKATGYGAALLAMGGTLFLALFPEASSMVRRVARRLAIAAAILGLAVVAVRLGLRAARLSGQGLAGAVDPVMLSLLWQSPVGTATAMRAMGEALVLALLLPGWMGLVPALAGTGLVAASYGMVGHALDLPGPAFVAILAVHLLAVALWVGALAPLRHAASGPEGVALLERFGRIAVWVVAGLLAAGMAMVWLLTGSLGALFGTTYGLVLLAKVAGVAGLLSLAAANKTRLVPALAAGRDGAAVALRRSIAAEMAVVAAILAVTATLTSVVTPPVNL